MPVLPSIALSASPGSGTQDNKETSQTTKIPKTDQLSTELQEKKEAPVALSVIEKETTLSDKPLFNVAVVPAPGHAIVEKETGTTGSMRKRKLTLADLFKSIPVTHEKNNPGEGTGDNQLIVVQGDVRYYTLWSNFLTHANQVANFHGILKQLRIWHAEGKIKRITTMSVTIDRKGNLIEYRMTQSSGYQAADDLLIKGIKLAAPFPPIPASIAHDSIRYDIFASP